MISHTHISFLIHNFGFFFSFSYHEKYGPKNMKSKVHKQLHGGPVYLCCAWFLPSVSHLVAASVNRSTVNSIRVPTLN